ncbi:hypothetical protein KO525_14055 [Psychrosphaera sp. B3R10]|uniref:Flagellar basal-body/hook protein C-terminal domain-containing protein n=1 Tax=Psychrosphaera algicola TaxID=3023714 RepID=A0ABT5FDY8_9GAMM|nr:MULTISPECIES: hypothetical protein [unclassified Psychrosphaera]MBU2883399.1 hypothetical protein [Psychrosphaera sp. I2R16]MBU2990507.1 hypothetical protein [Psychrosphaera sp. B3R10]MDC2889765.1 hypothetical protein [Psychrosphaera sp. G1-22]MDO6719019.1 hypothetical protein [Psychrosphaera sp. 1_MG-2023]
MDISNVSSAVVSGLNGYKAAEQGIEQASVNINQLQAERDVVAQTDVANDQNENAPRENTPPPVSLNAEAVNLVVNEHLAKANVNVIKTADDVVGTLIDTKV